jgi:hypothetical protein
VFGNPALAGQFAVGGHVGARPYGSSRGSFMRSDDRI